MPRKLLRVLLGILAFQVAAWIFGQVIAKKMARGDEGSDEFQVAAIFGGKEFQSRAESLKSGSAIVSMGGMNLDLRDATLDPEGAELDVKATMGGIQVTVPTDWAVDIDAESIMGGFDTQVTPPEDLPGDAPKLHIHAVMRMGGVALTTNPDD